MEKQHSFTKIEQEVRSGFRKNLNMAESTEDVKKFFNYASRELVEKALLQKVTLEIDDIRLDPAEQNGFAISSRLRNDGEFKPVWDHSDLEHVIKRFADPAVKRYKRLEKHPEKTQSKMFPTPK